MQGFSYFWETNENIMTTLTLSQFGIEEEYIFETASSLFSVKQNVQQALLNKSCLTIENGEGKMSVIPFKVLSVSICDIDE